MFELIVRIGFSLIIVLALMWLLARATRKKVNGRNGGTLSVISRQSLSRGSSVAVVKVADRALVLGVTENQVTLLGEADLAALEHQPEAPVRRDAVSVDAEGAPQALTVPKRSRDTLLDGSLLSGKTWQTALDFLRERTVRS